MPRPSKCTPEVRQKIVALVQLGVPRSVACQAAGIDDRTLRIWMRRALDGQQPYAEFSEELKVADAEGHGKLVARLYIAARGDWRAAAWLLSRKYPDLWGDQIQVKIEDGLKQILDIVEHVCSPEEFSRVLKALAAKDSGAAPPDQADTGRIH